MTEQIEFMNCEMNEKADRGQKARELFIERNAIQAEIGGLPRIAGRLIGVFLLDGGPISFSALAERMQASRASVSTNTRLLERLGIIERVAVRGERQDFFSLRANPFVRVLEQSVEECQRFSEYVDELLASSAMDEDAVDRLRHAQVFHDVTANTLQELLVTLKRNNWAQGKALSQTEAKVEDAVRADYAPAETRSSVGAPTRAKPRGGARSKTAGLARVPRKP